jgi:1,4-alpha-glucan branching enzyme
MVDTNKGKKRIKFHFYAKDAKQVCLVGDFNNWEADRHPMDPNPQGLWEKIIMLPPGRYEYKFHVDGKWLPDRENPNRCRNIFGTENSIITVPVFK